MLRPNYMLSKCVTQRVMKLTKSRKIYGICFDDEDRMSVQQFAAKSKCFEQQNEIPIEDEFWENMDLRSNGNAENPIYSIDNENSLFPQDCNLWNLDSITSDVSIIHGDNRPALIGVNTPYWYNGMPFTSFGLHVEDSNLGSINMVLKGKEKIWYAIPACHAKKLADLVQKTAKNYSNCNLFIRHKSVLIAPSELKEMNVPFARVNEKYFAVVSNN